MNPIIISDGEPINVSDLLVESRILFLSGFISDNIAVEFVSKLMVLNLHSKKDKISILLNSVGGDIRSVFMIYDMMKLVKAPIEITVAGSCEKESVLLLSAGTPTMRRATKNSIIIVSPLSYEGETITSLENIRLFKSLIEKDNVIFMNLLSQNCGKSVEDFKEAIEKKIYFTPVQAAEFGLIDVVVQ